MSGPQETPAVVTGLLEDFPLERLLVFLEACGVNGRLALTGGFAVTAVYLERGMAVHAQDAHGQGADAFGRAILREFERFSFEEGVAAPIRTLSGSNAQLILTTLRGLPASPRLMRTYTVSDDAVVLATTAAASHRAPVALTATEAAILSAVADGTTVESIAAATAVDVTLTRHVLLRLAAAGLVAVETGLRDGDGAAGLSPVRRMTPSELLRRLHPAAPLGFQVSTTDAQVFELVDGTRSLAEIGMMLGREVSAVRAAVETLQGLGLVFVGSGRRTE